jgi:hypothetical protein
MRLYHACANEDVFENEDQFMDYVRGNYDPWEDEDDW